MQPFETCCGDGPTDPSPSGADEVNPRHSSGARFPVATSLSCVALGFSGVVSIPAASPEQAAWTAVGFRRCGGFGGGLGGALVWMQGSPRGGT